MNLRPLTSLALIACCSAANASPAPTFAAEAETTRAATPAAQEGQVGPQQQRPKRARRRQQTTPKETAKAFADAEALAAGVEGLEAIRRQSGTSAWVDDEATPVAIDVWDSLPGLRFQQLETVFFTSKKATNANDGSKKWKVHHRLPRLVHLVPGVGGYMNTEVVEVTTKADAALADAQSFSTKYQRLVVDKAVAWGEYAGAFSRDGERNARVALAREQVFCGGPLAWSDIGLELALLEQDAETTTYAGRLKRASGLTVRESFTDFRLYVERASGLPTQWQMQSVESLQGGVGLTSIVDVRERRELAIPEELRGAIEERLVAAWRAARVRAWRMEGNEGEPPAAVASATPEAGAIHVPEAILIPTRMLLTTNIDLELRELAIELPQLIAAPDRAFERPWLTGEVWVDSPRADYWDPPKQD